MIRITDELAIDEDEIQIKFIRSSGPGGQNVNKVSTAVQLRFNVVNSPTLSEEVRARLMQLARNRITEEGILVIEARQYRSQDQNRQAAIERLVGLIFDATKKPKVRRKTKPSLRSKERRMKTKRRRSEIKRLRKTINDLD